MSDEEAASGSGSPSASDSGSSSSSSSSGDFDEFKNVRCELCGTTRERTNLHHLVPKLVLKRRRNKGQPHKTILARLCHTCHHTLHEKFTHAELARGFASVEEIEARPEMAEYLAWKRARA